jgi:hypothetical protein
VNFYPDCDEAAVITESNENAIRISGAAHIRARFGSGLKVLFAIAVAIKKNPPTACTISGITKANSRKFSSILS